MSGITAIIFIAFTCGMLATSFAKNKEPKPEPVPIVEVINIQDGDTASE
jgi:hypothetical protein